MEEAGRAPDETVGYAPDRVRQLRLLLWVVVGAAGLLALAAVLVVPVGSAALVLRPAALLLALAVGSLALLARGTPAARPVIAATAVVAILVGLLLSRTGVGLLFALVGVPLLLIAVLPGRDEPPSQPGAG